MPPDANYAVTVINGLPTELQTRILAQSLGKTPLLQLLNGIHKGPLYQALVNSIHRVQIRNTTSGKVQCDLDSDLEAHYYTLFERFPALDTLIILPSAQKCPDLFTSHPSLSYFLALHAKYIENHDYNTDSIYLHHMFLTKITVAHYRFTKSVSFVGMDKLRELEIGVFSRGFVDYKVIFNWLKSAPSSNPRLKSVVFNISPPRGSVDRDNPYFHFWAEYADYCSSTHSPIRVFVPKMQILGPVPSTQRTMLLSLHCRQLELKVASDWPETKEGLRWLEKLRDLTSLSLFFPVHPIKSPVADLQLDLPALKSLTLIHCRGYFAPTAFQSLSSLISFKAFECSFSTETPLIFPNTLQVLELSNSRKSRQANIDLETLPPSLKSLTLLNVDSPSPFVLDSHCSLAKVDIKDNGEVHLHSLPTSLQSISLIDVTKIVLDSPEAFKGCTNLRSVFFKPKLASLRNLSGISWPSNIQFLSLKLFHSTHITDLPAKIHTLSIDFPRNSTHNYIFISMSQQEIEDRIAELQDYGVDISLPDSVCLYLPNVPDSIRDVETWGDFVLGGDDSGSESLVEIDPEESIQDIKPHTQMSVILPNWISDPWYSILKDATEVYRLNSRKKPRLM